MDVVTRTDELTWKASRLVRFLERASAGRGWRSIAKDLAVAQADGILKAHGWPDRAKLHENIEALRRFGDEDVTFEFSYQHTVTPAACSCGQEFRSPRGRHLHARRRGHQVPA